MRRSTADLTTASWSCRWELITRKDPWDDIPYHSPFQFRADLKAAVCSGERPRMVRDESCDNSWHDRFHIMMQQCWSDVPSERPSFDRMVNALVAQSM